MSTKYTTISVSAKIKIILFPPQTKLFFFFKANCVKNKGRFYQGQQNMTHGGLECQEWFTSEPHTQTMPKGIFPEMNLAKNFCRNPGGTEPSPWCYTKDPLIRWQHCQIDKCGEFIIQTYIYRN